MTDAGPPLQPGDRVIITTAIRARGRGRRATVVGYTNKYRRYVVVRPDGVLGQVKMRRRLEYPITSLRRLNAIEQLGELA